MKPDSPEPAELQHRVRQQLILAQVRIMELEDARAELAAKLAEAGQLQRATQALADRKLDEAAHLEKVLADIQSHLERLHQQQVQANRDFEATCAALAQSEAQLAAGNATVRQLVADLLKLNVELAAIKSSRSWRWTAWLRALGGKPGDPQP